MHITVKTLTGKSIFLDVSADNTVADIKTMIHARENIAPGNQRLIFGGRVLQDDDTLAQCNITESTQERTMYVVLGMRNDAASTAVGTTEPQVRVATAGRGAFAAPVKVLILGNSGVGKSFLANMVVGEEVFAHKSQARSCTDKVETAWGLLMGSAPAQPPTPLVAYNMPGMIEANAANIARNKAAIETAFAANPEYRTVVFFVFSGSCGGRITKEDVAAWTAINDYLQPAANKYGAAIGLVVNGVDKDEFDDAQALDNYYADFTACVKALCSAVPDASIAFVEKIAKKDRMDMASPKMQQLRLAVQKAVKELLPHAVPMMPPPKAAILLEHEKLKTMIEEMMVKIDRLTEENNRRRDHEVHVMHQHIPPPPFGPFFFDMPNRNGLTGTLMGHLSHHFSL